ncbi:thiamine pyrophosphate-binding protein [Mycobacterium sp. SMC-18]|jgi:acetolactate synthase-1/2/3 large subunit|uniref:thiamine pyrophosphate-binding protein n=1 Tax=Mycobacteriaceae TaxID=1762 RepID=UPI000EC948DE|nr:MULTISPECIES: thiamine pyrophosphate-dependent enzyme [Mycolicibacterium]MCX8554525.1 thiamine pyrophosphate-binding protein [Mycolicibacterium mucogenicum]BCI79976.1 acetolactate synthase [Mycolicibacterium sp. TY66]BCJ82358.1 acetolactate synthase [Mycolicibacterium sp. TY81]GCA99750.1 acetolactate synthase [Mycolicibacterium sp. NCC-Tsukiji]
MVSRHRVVDHIITQLAASGVEYFFGVDGANIEDLFDAAFLADNVTAILAKHEFSAATMADGYSRAVSRIGVVAATSGGGSLNLVAGLGESLASRVPVLALVGQAPTGMDGRGSFQDTSGRSGSLDAVALFSAVSVYCRRVTEPEDIVPALAEALTAAAGGGPAVLLLPKDVQEAMIDVVNPVAAVQDSLLADPGPIAEVLRRALGPVTIIAGEQVARDDARRELEELRSVLRAWVATVPDGKDVSGSPGLGQSSWLGVTGVMGHPRVVDAISRSAVCLVIGTRLAVTARAGLDSALAGVQTVSLGAERPYVPSTHVNSTNLRASLTALTRSLTGAGRPHGLRVLDPLPHTELQPPPHDGPGIRYRDTVALLDELLPDGADIVVDAGNTGASTVHGLPVRRSGRFVVALGMGGMGYSFGAGIGMCFARAKTAGPQYRTVVVAGDGSFFMHGMELHTALEYRLPITFVLFNNNAHAMCVTREQLFYGDRYSYNRFTPARLGAGLAAMFPGLHATDVTELPQLAGALSEALSRHGPSVVSVECSADEIPTFAPFLDTATQQTQKESSQHVAARA